MNLQLFTRNGTPTRSAVRHEQAQRALEHAERVSVGWSSVAYHYLENYCRTHEIITGEEVTKAAREWGLEASPTDRAWGSLWRKAQRAGIIVYIDSEARRYNGSPMPRYRSLIFRAAA